MLLSGPSWPFLSCSQLGPDNNTYLAQIMTPQNGFLFLFFCFLRCAEIPIFIVFLNINQNWSKKAGKKKRFLLTFCKTQVDKKPFCCNPPFHQKIVLFKLFVLEPKIFMLNKKHNLKSGKKNKDKKRIGKKKQDRKPNKDKY